MVVFSLSYAIRGMWDLINAADEHYTFTAIMADLLLIGVFCDFVPIMPLLYFHYRNFKGKKSNDLKKERESMQSFDR